MVCRRKKKRIKAEKYKNRIDSGFTFIETLAVLTVSALLASQVTVGAMALVQKGKQAAAKNQIENYRIALQSYYIDCGRFPSEEQGLEALWNKPSDMTGENIWNGPYTEKEISRDPWGNSYLYFSGVNSGLYEYYTGDKELPSGLPFAIICLGADGKKGGTGSEKDICSWN